MTTGSEWTGPVGDAWATEWRRTDRSFAALSPYLEAAILDRTPTGPAAIVDIGCGAGATSLAIAAARPEADVTGIDISPGLIAVATTRGEGRDRLTFLAGDATVEVAALAPVDLFCSRHGVMFFDDPAVAFATLRRSAVVGASLVFSCFRAPSLNPWAAEIAQAIQGGAPSPPVGYVPGPFAFANPEFVATTLAAAGWQVDAAGPKPVDFLYRAGQGDDPVADAVDFFHSIGPAAPALRAAAPGARAEMAARIAAVAGRYRAGDAIDFPAAAWIWSVKA